jgi:hypothetical protein
MNKKILKRLDEISTDGVNEEFKELVEILVPIYNDYAMKIKSEIIFEYDEDVINQVLNGFPPNTIINQVVYGDFNPIKPFFIFDGYENLKSLDWQDVYSLYLTDFGFVEWFLDNE